MFINNISKVIYMLVAEKKRDNMIRENPSRVFDVRELTEEEVRILFA